MKHLRFALALLVAVAIMAAFSGTADAQGKKKGKFGKGVFGEITKVDLKDGTGTITVKSTPRRKKGEEAPEPKMYMVKITKDTKFMSPPKEKGGEPGEASVSDLKEGARVFVPVGEDVELSTTTPVTATRVFVMPPRKKGGGAGAGA